jgi:hypothetical protein
MTQTPGLDYGVPAFAITWLLAGAVFAARLAVRINRRRPLDAIDHLAGLFLTLLGPLASLALAYDVAVHGIRRKVRL